MAKAQDVAVDPEVLRLMREVEALRLELRAMGRQLAEAERLADHDVLTPLLNRRAFVREVQRAIALTRRHDTPASVIYFDLDDFKGVNDRFGHAAGDTVLIAVAERLLGHVREADAVGRIGGDEFAILLQHADLKAARAKAETLAKAVSDQAVAAPGGDIPVSLTWGARQIGAVDSAEQALSEADAAMYLRKPPKA
jgi:diguanylate cyclase (GGDEF)-like protein